MASVSIRRLTPDDAPESYVLAHLGEPDLSPERWRATIEADPTRGGVIGAFSGPTVRAILRYSVAATAEGERLFLIEALAAFDLFDPAAVAEPLLRAARRMAEADCIGLALSRRLDAPGLNDVLDLTARTAVLHRVF